MSDSAFTTQHVVRANNHVSHRTDPPARFYPWTNRADPDVRFAHLGWRAVNPRGDEAYCYLAPALDSATPRINVHFGGDGRPEFDPVVASIEVVWE